MPAGVAIRTDGGVITRAGLFSLAAADQFEQSDRSILELFWNTMAWGIAGTWRNVPRLATQVTTDSALVASLLRQAQRLSFEGQVRESYRALNQNIKFLGPAFFTKFLYFTADRSRPVHALILDERVRVAWRILVGVDLRSGYSQDYTEFCEAAAGAGRRTGLAPDEVEACLYHLGRQVGSYTGWLERSLRVYRERLGDRTPTIYEVLNWPVTEASRQ